MRVPRVEVTREVIGQSLVKPHASMRRMLILAVAVCVQSATLFPRTNGANLKGLSALKMSTAVDRTSLVVHRLRGGENDDGSTVERVLLPAQHRYFLAWPLRALLFGSVALISIVLTERLWLSNWLSKWWPLFRTPSKDEHRAIRIFSLILATITHNMAEMFVLFRGSKVDCFAGWHELRHLRHAYSTAHEQGGVISPAAVFVSPASLFVTPIWFKAVQGDTTWRWYWTPYAQHKKHDWMPISKSTVDTTPRGIYQGSAPAKHNVRIIQYLHDKEADTAEKAVKAKVHQLFTDLK